MNIGDWITLAFAAVFVTFLMVWRVRVWRQYMAKPPRRHEPPKGGQGADEKILLQVSAAAVQRERIG